VHPLDHTPVDLDALYHPPVVPGVANPQTVQVYDLDRRLDDVIRPDGSVVDLAYALGRLESVTVPGRGLVDLVYEPAPTGRLASIATPEGNGLAFGYDGFLLEDRTWTGEVAGTVSQMHNDELLVATEVVTPGQAIQYLYDDDLPLLVTAQGQDLALGYDPDHGLLETTAYGQVTTAQDYTGFGELDFFEAAHGGSTLLFREDVALRDELGRILEVDITIGGTTTRHSYTYDGLGNLTRVVLRDGAVIEYVIDGRSRRIGKKVCPAPCGGGTPTFVQGFLYRDGLSPVAELDGSGQLVSQFVYASRAHIPDLMIRGGVVYRVLSDHLGNMRLVVNAITGAIAQRIDYDALGQMTMNTNPGFQPFGFAGGLYDADTELTRFGARDYKPTIGRWTT